MVELDTSWINHTVRNMAGFGMQCLKRMLENVRVLHRRHNGPEVESLKADCM